MTENFDVAILGAGPGGYVAAIRAAQLGMNVVCIDPRQTLGGTCLNVGCIPSKALLYSSEKYHDACHNLEKHGIRCKGVDVDLSTMMARKDQVVKELTQGIAFLFKKNKIQHMVGFGRLISPGVVEVSHHEGSKSRLSAKHIIIATGSESSTLPGIEIDEQAIVSSTGALSLSCVPEHLVVIGAGYIGLEMASVWNRLGSKVTVVEYLPRITPGMDLEVSQSLQKILSQQGIQFMLSTKVLSAEKKKSQVVLKVESQAGEQDLACHVVLVAVGRKPVTYNIGLEDVGIHVGNRGFIEVDQQYRTNVSGIYAIGDVIKGPMLAHLAEEEGIACVETIAGQHGHVNYGAIPGVIYTSPEVASVGMTEEQLKEQGAVYKVAKFPFQANSRAKAMGMTQGYIKLLTDSKTDRLLGAHIIGVEAGTLIAELVMAMEYHASGEDIARICHAHPTLNEAVKEAAWAAFDRALHS